MSMFHIEPKFAGRHFSIMAEVKRRSKVRDADLKSITQVVQKIVDSPSGDRSYIKNGSVAHISVEGVLMPARSWMYDWMEIRQTSYRDILNGIARAEADEDIVDIYLDINSPGGYVEMSDEVADAIANASKKVTAVVTNMCASAAYKLASQADTIVSATRGAKIGSIGTVVDLVDYSGWEEEVGIKSLSITNRKSTDKRPDISTEEGQDVVRDEMDDIQEIFELYIEEGRSGKNNFSMDNVHSLNGRVVNSIKALELGLIDKIGVDETVLLRSDDDTLQSNNKGGSVNLQEILAQNPEAKKQYEEDIAQASAASDEKVTAESARVNEILSAANVVVPESAKKAIAGGMSKSDYIVSAFESGELKMGGASQSTAPIAPQSQVPSFGATSSPADDAHKSGDKFNPANAESAVNKLFNQMKNGDR